jgi:NAD(P)H dehydrogenase (quinone)
MPSQIASFLDQAGGLWARGALHGKVGGAFSSTATQHGGQEVMLFSVITKLLHFGMIIVGLPYNHQGQMMLDDIVGGSPYGTTTIAGGQGQRLSGATELDGARFLGRRIADTANRAFRRSEPGCLCHHEVGLGWFHQDLVARVGAVRHYRQYPPPGRC